MAAEAQTNREFWLKKAQGLSRQINLGWWLETLAIPLLFGSVAAAAALLLLRRWHPEWGTPWMTLACGGTFLLLAFICWLSARRKFEKIEQSLVRLEAGMGLHNALSSASAGILPWPAPQKIHSGLVWQWSRLVLPPIGALALVAAGLFIPLSGQSIGGAPAEQPQSWKQLTKELDRLADEHVVDEKYLEDTRKKLDELKAQEEEQWFSHSSLEATDSLKKSHQAEAERMEQDLDKAQKALESLEKNAANPSSEQQKKQLDDFQQAMEGLQKGAMKPNPKLLEQMKQMNPDNFSKLTPEQMQQLKDNLKKHADAMKEGKGEGKGEGDDWSDELMGGNEGGEKEGQGKPGGNKPGKGGIDRGPGHDPDVLGNEKDGVEIGDPTALNAKDLSHATPGDLLELQDDKHDVDVSTSKQSQGGSSDATGKGGDRVWKDSLNPDEQRAVKRFFK